MRFEPEPLLPNRANQALLASLPYLLLGGWLMTMIVLVGLPGTGADATWQWARWGLRLLFVLGAAGVWYGTLGETPRPRWVYGWVGFAIYESVGVGLLGIGYLNSSGWLSGTSGILMLPLLGLAFLPYFILALVVGHYDREAVTFAVFPHAALTIPLFIAGLELWLPNSSSMLYWGVVVLIALAGAVVAYVATTERPSRISLLYAGVILCQCATALLVGVTEVGTLAIIALVIFVMLGVMILSGPFILDGVLSLILTAIHNRMSTWLPITILGLIERFLGIKDDAQLKTGSTTPSAKNLELVPPSTFWEHSGQNAEGLPGMTTKLQHVGAESHALLRGDQPMNEMNEVKVVAEELVPPVLPPRPPAPQRMSGPGFDRLFRLAVIVLALFAIGALITALGRSTIYKIHEYERGLHLRGGRFLAVQHPGWHFQIPLVDTVIIVKVNERLGYVERIPAMTSDNVTMIVSLQYTYKVTDPEQFALQVDDPERIVFEFVQGKLRDVVNTKAMADVMNNRVVMNDQVMAELKGKESQYGVQFVTVQMQSASPPDEVLTAIKDRMVAAQRQEQAQAEAQQKKTQADADFYTAQKQAQAEAYQITQTAEAEAERIRLTTEAQQLSIRSIITELKDQGTLGEKYVDYLIAQQLKENSKWVISGDSTPILDLRDESK